MAQRKETGKYLYDLGKLSFAGLVVGGLIGLFQFAGFNTSAIAMLICGAVLTLLFTYAGNYLNK